MAVIKHPTKEGWWILDIRNGKKGPRDRIPYPGTWDQAQTEYARLTEKKNKLVTSTTKIGQLVNTFVNWYKLEKSADTIIDFWYAWKRLEPHFGALRFVDITTPIIDEYKGKRLQDKYLPGKPEQTPDKDTKEERARRKPISKRTISRELAYFSAMCKWAKANGYTTNDIVVKGFPKKQTKAPIQTTQTFEEMQRIVDKTEESVHYKDDRRGLILLMYDAGLRKKEARLIEAERVELPPEPVIITKGLPPYYGHIRVTRKGDKEQMLPILTERLYLELKKRKEKTKRGYLYINPVTEKPYVDIRAGLKNTAERAGVTKRITHHLLRHNFVTHLHEGGADLKTIQGLAGHAQIQTTLDIYAHLDDLKLARLAGGFADKINTYGKPQKSGQKK